MSNFFKRQRPSTAPDVVYPSSLSVLCQGHALWYPEPHVTGEAQIGDVGFVREGAFIRIFNLNSSRPEHKVTFWGSTFEPTTPPPPGVFDRLDTRRSLPPDHYHSSGVERVEMSGSVEVAAGPNASVGVNAGYTCRESQGAVLVINSPAHQQSTFPSELLQKYMLAHHGEWHAYAKNVLGLSIKREDIVLLIGWVKTSADWKAVAFTRSSASYQAGLEGHAFGVAGAELRRKKTRELEPPRMHREGSLYPGTRMKLTTTTTTTNTSKPSTDVNHTTDPSDLGGPSLSIPDEEKEDQCAFLKRYQTKRRGVFKIVAEAGSHRLPRQEGGSGGQGGERLIGGVEDEEDYQEDLSGCANEGMIADPLETLLEYIFEVSVADTAIASDDDIESLVCGERVVDFATYLRLVQPPVGVDGAVGSISIPEMISRDQERAVARRAIAPTDIYKWPGLSFSGASSLKTGKACIGPYTRSLKWSHFIFQDSLSESKLCLCLAVSTDGRFLAAGFDPGTVIVWRLSDGLLVQRLHDHDHTDRIRSVAFSPNTLHLVSGSNDQTATVWDIRSGHALLRLEGHQGTVLTVAYSPNGSRIATGSVDQSVKIWDTSSGGCLRSLDLGEEVYEVIFLPNGARLAVELRHTGAICDVETGRTVATLRHENGERMCLSLSSQGDRIVTGTGDGKAKIWSAVTGKELLELSEHTSEINSAVFSPDGAEVATGSDDCTVVTSDSWTGQRRHVYRMASAMWSMEYSPNSSYIVMGDSDGHVRVCDARSGAFVAEFEGHTKGVDELLFLPDGHRLLSRSEEDRTVRLWSIRDAMRLH